MGFKTMRGTSVGLLLLLLSGCRESSLERLRREGAIRVGYAVEAPYAFVRPDGTVTGIHPELTRRAARHLGIARVQFRQTRFGALLEDLEAGLVDVDASGLFITPGRQQRVLFTTVTAEVRASLLVASGNPLGLTGYPGLARHPTARVAVLEGSVEASLVQRLGVPSSRVLVVPDAQGGVTAVQSGLADALALSEPTLKWATRQAGASAEIVPDVVQPPGTEYPARFALAVRLDEVALANALNDALRVLAETAEYAELLEEFGFAPLAEAAR